MSYLGGSEYSCPRHSFFSTTKQAHENHFFVAHCSKKFGTINTGDVGWGLNNVCCPGSLPLLIIVAFSWVVWTPDGIGAGGVSIHMSCEF